MGTTASGLSFGRCSVVDDRAAAPNAEGGTLSGRGEVRVDGLILGRCGELVDCCDGFGEGAVDFGGGGGLFFDGGGDDGTAAR